MDPQVLTLSLFLSITFHVILVLLFKISIAEPASALILGNETDKFALLEFKSQITEDPNRIFASWNDSLQFCKWNGVKCGLKHQRVIILDLKGQNLVGHVSPHIANLSFLRVLDLAENSFRGKIPPQLGRLVRLQTMNLSFNLFAGEIPVNISHCTGLINLALDHNYLDQHIPSKLGSLQNLVTLYLKNNNLTGRIPSSFGNLTSLQELYLSYNELVGEIPSTLSRMSKLTTIGLSVNTLSGEFPPALYNLSSLELLSLSFNNFTGPLRADFSFKFPNLQLLYLAFNYFMGPIPISLSNASDILRLDIPKNNFTGNIPTTFGNLQNLRWLNVYGNKLGTGADDDLEFLNSLSNCSKLEFLDFAENQLGGVLPNSITNLSTTLTRLLIGKNNIRGSIPEEISNLENLVVLNIQYSFITGNIPASIGKLSNLRNLHLEVNQLTGNIPSSFGNISRLLYLYMSYNSLEGSIPASLGNCMLLQSLDLSHNKLNGTIPKQLMHLSSLSVIFYISYNSLTGPFPEEVGNLTNLVDLDVSNNNLTGEVPRNLRNCIALGQLYMQNNFFQGNIPSLADLKNIQYLDLSWNNLSGEIPQNMENLSTLVYLNLSFNNLEGSVPLTGVFKNASGVELLGNTKLCGGIPELYLQPCPIKTQNRYKKHISLNIIFVTVGVTLCLVLLLLLFSLFWVKRLKKNSHPTYSFGQFYPKISFEELSNATGGFSSTNLIGSGNFGSVYKGTLAPDATIVAVKVLKLQTKGAPKSFIAECEALRSIRHRNLVKVLTACSSIDFEGNDFKALVYQYMPNGSLEEWLHSEDEEKRLSVLQRINIAIDVAAALNYLHNQCEALVIHCDLKPSNVLLNSDLTAHVSDFGLARLLSKSQDANLTPFSSLGIKGTVGYAPPEYGMGGRVSTQGDVYSFGILLLEMFTGRRPTDERFRDNVNLHNYVKAALPNQVMEIVHQAAMYNEEVEDTKDKIECGSDWRHENTEDCLISVFEIGVSCSEGSPQGRIDMRQVSMDLLTVRDKFLESGTQRKTH